jgi:hypothetical protein
MSAFTDRLYGQWRARNGGGKLSPWLEDALALGARRGGMGAMAPMVTVQPPARLASRVHLQELEQLPAARPERPENLGAPGMPASAAEAARSRRAGAQAGNFVPEMCIVLAALCTTALFFGL